MAEGSVVVLGGTGGLVREVVRHYHDQGKPVVITGSDDARTKSIAAELGPEVTGIGFDLASPASIADAVVGRTPTGTTMQNVNDAVVFLLENPAVNGVDLHVDGGWMSM